MSESKPGGDVAKSGLSSASVVMAATLVSRLLGFVRQGVINAVFGASGTADVLNTVFNIPNNLRKLLAEGALSSAFIPVLSQSLADESERAAGIPRQVVRNLLAFQALILVPVMVISVIIPGPISRILMNFPIAAEQSLAADLFRWFIHYTLLISISAVLVGSLNSSNRFAVPAITPIIFSVCVITSVLTLHRHLGVYSMAVGVLVGGVGQILFQTPQFLKQGFDFRLSFSFGSPHFRRILRQWLPVVASSSVFVVNQLIAFKFATGLEDGSPSALANAVVFWQLPLGIFGVSVITVLFPRMSREATADRPDSLRATVSYGLRAIAALLIPSAVIIGALSHEIIAVAFQRRAFTAANTAMTARVLTGYCYGMVSVGMFNFLQRSFYARSDYGTPAYTALVVLVVDVALSLWLKETALRVAGLAVANTVAFTVGAVVLLLVSRRALGGLEGRRVGSTVLRSVAATAPALVIMLLFRMRWGENWQAGSTGANLGALATVGILCAAIVVGLYWALKVEAVTILLRRRPK